MLDLFISGKTTALVALAGAGLCFLIRRFRGIANSQDKIVYDVKDWATVYAIGTILVIYTIYPSEFKRIITAEFAATQFYLALFGGIVSALETLRKRLKKD